MARATKRQLIEREEDIQTAIRLGQEPTDFAKVLATKHKCSPGSIMRQYREIINYLAETQKDEREGLRAELEMQAKHIQSKALEQDNLKHALDAINQRAKLAGLYNPAKEEAAKEPPKPVFNFVPRDNSVPLAVVPKDDDESTGS